MRLRLIATVHLFLSLPLAVAAQSREPEPAPRYLVLDTIRVATMRKELTTAASQGYRIVAATPAGQTGLAMILERASPADATQYLLIAESSDSGLQTELNAAAAQGFRVLPVAVFSKLSNDFWDGFFCEMANEIHHKVTRERFGERNCIRITQTVVLMEKRSGGEGSHVYEYAVTSDENLHDREMEIPLGPHDKMVAALTGENLTYVLERYVGSGGSAPRGHWRYPEYDQSPPALSPDPTPASRPAHAIFLTSRVATLERQLRYAATQSYRVVSVSSFEGYLAVFEKSPQATSSQKHMVLARRKAAALQKELDVAASRGFHVVPRTTTRGGWFRPEVALVLEHPSVFQHTHQYLVLHARRETALQMQIIQASEQGYRIVGFTKPREFFVIMEKTTEWPVLPSF